MVIRHYLNSTSSLRKNTKWIWRISSANRELWFNILKAKYFPSGVFREARTLGGSQFWKSVMKVKHLFNLGIRYKVGNGQDISFWEDVWVNDCSFKLKYNNLFHLCQLPSMSVYDGVKDGSWDISFRRSFGAEETQQWEDMKRD